MIKVIKKGKPRKSKCIRCDSIIQYEYEDVQSEKYIGFLDDEGFELFITCPICGNRINVGYQ